MLLLLMTQVTSGGGSPIILTSKWNPSFSRTVMSRKFLRSIFGGTAEEEMKRYRKRTRQKKREESVALKLIENVLTSSTLGCDGFAGVGWFARTSGVYGLYAELVLHALVEIIDASFAVRSGFESLYPPWTIFFALLDHVSGDWRSTIGQWWSPS